MSFHPRNAKGITELSDLLTDLISSLAALNGDKCLTEICSNVKFLSLLNFSSFARITHSIIKIIDCEIAEKLPSMVNTSKDKDNFAKSLLVVANEVKNKFPWAVIPMCQKSHLLDARAENDKVLEFLFGLASMAAFSLAQSKGDDDLCQLTKDIEHIEEAAANLQKITLNMRDENINAIEKSLERPKKLLVLKEGLVNAGIVEVMEEAVLEGLLKAKEKVDKENLQVISQVLKLAQSSNKFFG